MTKDGLMTHGVLKIADITNRKVEAGSKSTLATADPKADLQTKVATAKLHANREMKEIRERTQELVKFLNSSALFPELGALVDQLLIRRFLEGIVEPTLAGNRLMGLPQEAFNSLRCNMYKALIEKYVDNAGK
jgi:hypothetical protein